MENESKLVQKVTVDAVIIRADGTKENLGTIYSYTNTRMGRLKHFLRALWRKYLAS